VVVSHGSGSAPWVHADLARTLVEAGFVVAMPLHCGDSHQNSRAAGPDSWAKRPGEVSRAIDAVGRDPRWAPLLALDKVGVYGFSAGGHTVLSLAGGRWSPSGLRDHCLAHLGEDFNTCAGLATRLTGGWADGFKKWAVRRTLNWLYDDETVQSHHDPRIAAAVAAAPHAAAFDMASFAQPRVPLALISVGQDRWLVPRFHSDRVLAACPSCVHLAHLPSAGHGAMRSPAPLGLTGLRAELVSDPPGFDRRVLPEIDRKVAAFMAQHLL
jgi:predicted dienelactone hydrolase